jgi:hypothetical protein
MMAPCDNLVSVGFAFKSLTLEVGLIVVSYGLVTQEGCESCSASQIVIRSF